MAAFCEVCGGALDGRVKRFCSKGCQQWSLGRLPNNRCRDCGEPAYEMPVAPKGAQGPWGPRYCGGCKRKRRLDTRRAAGARRRGVVAVPYSREAIFERDGWRCHLCGGRVLRSLPVSHPEASSIDHLVPLSAGGPDAPENVRLAHLRCNSVRQAGGEVQLLLVG